MNAPAPDKYDMGQALPEMHPDEGMNAQLKIIALCANLDIARSALGQALEMNVVTPAAVSMKGALRWALDETHPQRFHEPHNNHG